MSNTRIKICGINDPAIAAQLVELPIDYIGLVFHPKSVRNVDMKVAEQIMQIIRNTNIKAVAVCVKQTVAQMQNLYEQLGIEIMQLHSEFCQQQAKFLPDNIQKIWALPIDEITHLPSEVNKNDYLLFDSTQPGSGAVFSAKKLPEQSQPFFIAGGLTPENVAEKIRQFQPFGVDVSSGVESKLGKKSIVLVKQFISEVTLC